MLQALELPELLIKSGLKVSGSSLRQGAVCGGGYGQSWTGCFGPLLFSGGVGRCGGSLISFVSIDKIFALGLGLGTRL